ncbi:MAG: GNAT family N-acetyltransferase [Marinilabiliales bacterium]|nr:GNAT family N-acetyltransferase [Marinilabiliales bacterium]
MDIRSLKDASLEKILSAFLEAFADYDISFTAEALKTLWKRRGFDPGLSFAAFEGEEIVAFTLNGIGDFEGKRMAYDTGTGTRPGYRGQGLASRIFHHSLPYLKEAKVGHYLLEVLQNNQQAISLYQKMGFTVRRELNYFIWDNAAYSPSLPVANLPYTIGPVAPELLPGLNSFRDFEPSWQNSFESIMRTQEDFLCLAAIEAGAIVGYCIFEPRSGDITQLAVDPSHRRRGIASQLMAEALRHNRHSGAKLLNADTSCQSIPAFLNSQNIRLTGKQYEMIREI